jgi:large subunit ribosomal protein L4
MAKTSGVNISLIKQAVLAKQANARQATSATKTRGMVRGGGKKPWKQKGTGRARAGTSSSPIWVGGGKVFGPHKDRNYKTRLPKKMQRAAFAEMLRTMKDRVVSVPSLAMKAVKTKEAVAMFAKHDLKGSLLLVTETMQPELLLATGNLKNVEVKMARDLSITDLFDGRTVVMEAAVYTSYYGEPKAKTAAEKPSAKKTTTKSKKSETK